MEMDFHLFLYPSEGGVLLTKLLVNISTGQMHPSPVILSGGR